MPKNVTLGVIFCRPEAYAHASTSLKFRHQEKVAMSRSRKTLFWLFAGMLLLLLAFTVRASSVRGVFDNGPLMGDVWFQVTLLDAYLGFLTVYVWIAWKERTLLRRLLWFVIVMTCGNMAVSLYVLVQLVKLPPGSNLADILTMRNEVSSDKLSNVHRGDS